MDNILPLAELTQADLDEETLQALLRDWQESTQVLEVTVKGGATRRAQLPGQSSADISAGQLARRLRDRRAGAAR